MKPQSQRYRPTHIVPGWNTYVKDSHNAARDAFYLWKQHGSPRNGPVAYLMRHSQAVYKYCLRSCKKQEQKNRADNIANSLMNIEKRHDFWNNVKKVTNSKPSLPNSLDGVNGAENIAELWKEHFHAIFNSVNPSTYDKSHINNFGYEESMVIAGLDVQHAISTLPNGKSSGLDNLTTEHFKHCSNRIYHLLSMPFTGFLAHNLISTPMITSVIVPIIKDKYKDICSKYNYRPIGISCSSAKIFETILLHRLHDYLNTISNQFGFKHGQSTEMCIFFLKEVLHYLQRHGSTSFVCFMDAS